MQNELSEKTYPDHIPLVSGAELPPQLHIRGQGYGTLELDADRITDITNYSSNKPTGGFWTAPYDTETGHSPWSTHSIHGEITAAQKWYVIQPPTEEKYFVINDWEDINLLYKHYTAEVLPPGSESRTKAFGLRSDGQGF